MEEKKESKFDFQAFKEYSGNAISEWFAGIPEEWKSTAADYIACQAVIMGSFNTYEGIGIFEAVKTEYVRLCEEFASEDEDEMRDDCRARLN